MRRPDSSSEYFVQRIPADLRSKVAGRAIRIDFRDGFVLDKVISGAGQQIRFSLRTRDPSKVKVRNAIAAAYMEEFWQSLRQDAPIRLTHAQVVALSGEVYRHFDLRFTDDPGDTEFWSRFGAAIEAARGTVGTSEERFGPYADALLASDAFAVEAADPRQRWETRTRLIGILAAEETPPSDDMLERLFGTRADRLLREKTLFVDDDSRTRLMRAIADAELDVAMKLKRNAKGDYRPDPNAERFPEWQPPAPARPQETPQKVLANGTGRITAAELFRRWEIKKTGHAAPNTIRRYSASWISFDAFLKQKDVRDVTADDVYSWAEHRRDVEGASARSINRNDFVAVSSVYAWAASRDSGRLVSVNPVKEVGERLPEPARQMEREKPFRAEEIRAILTAASKIGDVALEDNPSDDPSLSFARRWCPWIAAYTGARITEITGLTGADVRDEGGIPVIDIRKTKTGVARTVPLHEHLIQQGFLDFVKWRGRGPLFISETAKALGNRPLSASGRRQNKDKGPAPIPARPPVSLAEKRSKGIAKWVRRVANLDPALQPNHAWRHTWKTAALGVGIEPRLRDAIVGHGPRDVARGYETPPISVLAAALQRLPRYAVEAPKWSPP